ncbi:MAG: hypothetical protein ACXV46_03380 [Halobacteriota archaeon]
MLAAASSSFRKPKASRLSLKRGELVHYVTPTALNEMKTVSLGYSGGSHGISVPLPIKIGGARFVTELVSHVDTW